MINVYFEAIIAPPFNEGVFRLYILNEARKIITEIKNDFRRTVKTWTTKPKFENDLGFTATTLRVGVFTTDTNYVRVSEGTKGKPRVARGYGGVAGAKALTLIPYIPKTDPGTIDAHAGGVQEGPIIFRRYALNAGKIKARKFDELVYEIWDEKFSERLQEAVDAAAIKTGYAF